MGSSTTPIDKESIGQRLAAVRNHLQMSQAAFAEAVGLSRRAYIHYERGEREAPSGLVKALHDLYAIDPAWLLSGPGYAPQRAESQVVNFALVDRIVALLDQELARHGREMRPEHRARVMKALYRLSVDQGRIDQDVVADLVAVAVARGR